MFLPFVYRCLALASIVLLRDLILIGALSAQGNPAPGGRRLDLAKGIIGKDDRQAIASGRSYPWTAIGRVFPGNCTATLVGADLLLTNAHCVLNYEHDGQQYQEITFHPNIAGGQVPDSSDVAQATEVIAGTNFQESTTFRQQYQGWRGISLGDSAKDWALLRLNKPLGLKYGYWRWHVMPTAELVEKHRNKLLIAGYPHDFHQPGQLQHRGNTLAVQEGCSILKEDRNMYYHDCDTVQGSSGSPIFYRSGDNYFMVALNNATKGSSNFAVNLRELPAAFLPDKPFSGDS